MKENIKMKLKKKFIKVIVKLGKRYYLDKFTNGIGKIVETDDKFICYINNKKIKNVKYGNTELVLRAYYDYLEDMIKVYKFYKINKPIYYFIDGYNFKSGLCLCSLGNAYVTFKNCVFNSNIVINSNNSVTFIDNEYNDCNVVSKTFFEADVKELKFINDKFYNSDNSHYSGLFGLDIVSERLEVINSNIMIDNCRSLVNDKSSVSVKSKEIIFKDSCINASIVCLDYENADIINSNIISSKAVIIDDKSKSTNISCVKAPYFVYNNEQVIKEVRLKEDLSAKRKELTTFLINLRNICLDINNNKSVRKVLKR